MASMHPPAHHITLPTHPDTQKDMLEERNSGEKGEKSSLHGIYLNVSNVPFKFFDYLNCPSFPCC